MLYRSLLRPILFTLPPETAHELALHSLPLLLRPNLLRNSVFRRSMRSPFGELHRFGLRFPNPIGLAAGFDKDGIALDALASLGFGFIEAGSVTLQPQPGNPRPRLFRLPRDKALINRAGFNNCGAAEFARHVAGFRSDCVLGVSIGKSRVAPLEAATEDYLGCFDLVYPVADYIAVNVSSPNTPGLRDLQRATQLENLLRELQKRNHELASRSENQAPMPLLVKIAPDLEDAELEMIVEVVRRTEVSGIIATNTTISRARLRTAAARIASIGDGGLSGAPLASRATSVVSQLYRLTGGAIPIIGVGGIFSARDAWEKICAGASLVQLYTGFIYEGPTVVRRINEGLREILDREGFSSFDQAVGSRAGVTRQQ